MRWWLLGFAVLAVTFGSLPARAVTDAEAAALSCDQLLDRLDGVKKSMAEPQAARASLETVFAAAKDARDGVLAASAPALTQFMAASLAELETRRRERDEARGVNRLQLDGVVTSLEAMQDFVTETYTRRVAKEPLEPGAVKFDRQMARARAPLAKIETAIESTGLEQAVYFSAIESRGCDRPEPTAQSSPSPASSR